MSTFDGIVSEFPDIRGTSSLVHSSTLHLHTYKSEHKSTSSVGIPLVSHRSPAF